MWLSAKYSSRKADKHQLVNMLRQINEEWYTTGIYRVGISMKDFWQDCKLQLLTKKVLASSLSTWQVIWSNNLCWKILTFLYYPNYFKASFTKHANTQWRWSTLPKTEARRKVVVKVVVAAAVTSKEQLLAAPSASTMHPHNHTHHTLLFTIPGTTALESHNTLHEVFVLSATHHTLVASSESNQPPPRQSSLRQPPPHPPCTHVTALHTSMAILNTFLSLLLHYHRFRNGFPGETFYHACTSDCIRVN